MYAISEETTDEDLPQVWAAIIARVNKKTNWNLNEKNVSSINQVILKINPGKEEKPEAHEKAKNVWKTTLVCVDRLGVFVQRFGAFAAQAASVVFGPSQQCFNAINFVISAAQQYKEIFFHITVLFERVSVFLENLNMYMDNNNAEVKLDKRLRKTVYRVLEHLVEILGTTHSLTTDWKARMKLKAKSFAFGEDEGIKASLATLETLVSDFTGAQISMIVQDLSEAARNIRGVDKKLDVLGEAAEKQTSMLGQLTAADDKRKANEQEKKDLEIISKALGIDDSKRPWDRQQELWDSHVAGTGEWLLEKTYFSLWADPKAAAATEVLAIKAPPGFGKSYLSSIVTRHLQNKHREDSRVLVTWYYFYGEKLTPLNMAMKTIISQFSKLNSEHRKAAAKACDGGIEFTKTSEVFKRLVTFNVTNREKDIAKSDMTLYVILDGVDELERETEKPLIDIINQIRSTNDKTSRLKVRMLLTGTKKVLDPISDGVDSTLPEVNLESVPHTSETSMNEQDLLLYVEHRLNAIDRLQKVDKELKERIKGELASGARGAYSRLDYLLDDLANIQNTSQIADILKRANQSLPEIIAGKIKTLNNTLTREEIREVNELLSWISESYEDLKVGQCEAVLSLRAEGQSIGLDERIRKRYAELFTVDENKSVTLREGMQNFLSEANEAAAKDESNKSSTEAVQEAEVALVRKVLQAHFKHVFGDEEVYSRFQFEDFFQRKLGDSAPLVRLNVAECHVKIAQGCLLAICDKYDDAQCKDLLPYAYYWFIEHIGEVDIEKTDTSAKQDIGRKLGRLLQEPALIESWWAPERMYLRSYVVFTAYSKELLQTIHDWLKDPIVQKGMSDTANERREWVAKVTAGDSPSFDLYGKVARIMAVRWFESSEDSEVWGPAFSWLRGWTQSRRGEEAELGIDASAELIGEMELWAKEELNNADNAAKWHICIARTLLDYSLFESATARFRQAVELQPNDWELQVELAEALGGSEKYDEALNTIEAVLQAKDALLSADDAFTKAYYSRLLPDIGNWKAKKKDFAAAEIVYREVLDHGLQQEDLQESTHKAVLNMLLVLNGQHKFASVIDLLNQLAGRADPAGRNWIALLFQEYWADDSFHNHLLTAAKRSSTIQPIAEKYEHAIRAERLEEMGYVSLFLQLSFGGLLWALGTPQEQDTALEMWEQIIFTEPNEAYAWSASYARVYAARYLSSALLSRAKATVLSHPLSSIAQIHALRLEKIVDLDLGQASQDTKNPRLTLGRLYHLAGDRKRAADTLRNFLTKAFEEAERQTEQGQSNDGFYKIAITLQSVNDDVNATVAWCQYAPNDPEDMDGGPSDNANEADSDVRDSGGEIDGKPENPVLEPQATAGAEREDTNGVATKTPTTLSNGVQTDCKSTSETEEEDSKPTLKGTLGNSCDGLCGAEWTYADDFYACKDCLDVQFDPVCYHKLKAGELDVPICGSDHQHIHIPPFNEATWRSTPKDHVLVDGALMLRSMWLEGIKKDWQIDEESMKAKQRSKDAAHSIQRAWKIFKAVGPNR